MLKKGDIFLIAAIIVLVAAGFSARWLAGGSEGEKVAVIKQDNKIINRINLDKITKPEEIIVKGAYSDTILVEKGRIRFETADCPDKVCVKTGWISSKGSTAVCLPNRTIIKIEGNNEQVDGGTY